MKFSKTKPKRQKIYSSKDLGSQKLSDQILAWYLQNKRSLPWRKNRNPYSIWISEIMLQQTTVQAVLPFYERFLQYFPTVESLAQAPIEKVLPLWAGLGYYSRARNLHKTAQIISQTGFPKSFSDLLALPGLGPYTARAISSLAFDEPVGVLDGNVIRILCRVYGLANEWWRSAERDSLQEIADLLAQKNNAALINQAMMELGATVCTPKKPACSICPWQTNCIAFREDTVLKLPLKKVRKSFEIWYWTPNIIIHQKNIALIENKILPFLKKTFLPPGTAKKLAEKPKQFDFLHTITHHKIYVKANCTLVSDKNFTMSNLNSQDPVDSQLYRWVKLKQLSEVNPSSLLQKTLKTLDL